MTSGHDPLLLGIDVGTSRIKAALFDRLGRMAASATRPTPTRPLAPGSAEHPTDGLLRATIEAVREAVARLPTPDAVRALAIASFGESGVLVDHHGRSQASVAAWFDNRPQPALDAFLKGFGTERLGAQTGLCPDATFSLAKLLWQQRELSSGIAPGTRWLAISEWLAWKLSGRMATDLGQASRTSLLDIRRGAWCRTILEHAGLQRSLLPECLPLGTALGPLTADAARALGLARDCVVAVGGYDHVAGIIAAGIGGSDTLLDNVGTAEALSIVRDRPLRTAALSGAGINQGLFELHRRKSYLFAGLPTAGAAVSWYRRLQPHAAIDRLTEAARQRPGDAYFLPHLRLGAPPYPEARPAGAFVGLGDDDDGNSLFFTLLDGLALDVACTCELLHRLAGVAAPARIVAIGGGTGNRLWMQLKAAYFERPVDILDLPESTAWGAAILAGRAIGLWRDDDMPAPPPVAWQATPFAGIDKALAAQRRRSYPRIRQALRLATAAGGDI